MTMTDAMLLMGGDISAADRHNFVVPERIDSITMSVDERETFQHLVGYLLTGVLEYERDGIAAEYRAHDPEWDRLKSQACRVAAFLNAAQNGTL